MGAVEFQNADRMWPSVSTWRLRILNGRYGKMINKSVAIYILSGCDVSSRVYLVDW